MTETSSTQPVTRQFVTSDGYQHHYRHWKPAVARPTSYVVALHGIQSHSGWYEHSSNRLCEDGHEVLFVDRRGSGLNEKDRGHARHIDRLTNDVVQFLTEVRNRRNEEAPTAPVVLLGLSWGGKLAAVTAAQHGELIDGLALLYPGIRAKVHPTSWQQFKLSVAEAVEVEEKRIPIPLGEPSLFTTNVEKQNFIRSDLMALQDRIEQFQKLIFSHFRSGGNNECRISALVPLVQESYGIYKFITSMLRAMHTSESMLALCERSFLIACSNRR